MFASKEFLRFVLVGGFAALVNFLSRIGLSEIMGFRAAVAVAYVVGMLTAFMLSKLFVFQASGRHPAHELLYFSLVNLFAAIQVWAVSVGLAEYLLPTLGVAQWREAIAHAIGIAIPVFTSYLGHKRISFRPSASRAP
jgi:putative flippase GtrA